MRVTHVVATSEFAGVERYVTYVAPRLVEAGLEVSVVGGDAERMCAALEGSAVDWQPFEGLLRTVRALRRQRVDLLHAHMTAAELIAVGAAAGRDTSVVATRHFAHQRGSSAAARVVGRRLARRIDRQVAISRFVADSIEGQSEIIPNGVPDAPFGPHDQDVVLVCQRMEAEKDTATALRAWQLSGLAEHGWRLVLAGRGDQRPEMEALIEELGIAGSVSVAGFVSDLGELMSTSRIMAASAPAEPFGLAVVEAMAHGLPVVAAAGGAHLETVGEACPESMFPPGDAEAAAVVLRTLADDEGRRRTEGEALRRLQTERFSLDRHVTALVELYGRVVG